MDKDSEDQRGLACASGCTATKPKPILFTLPFTTAESDGKVLETYPHLILLPSVPDNLLFLMSRFVEQEHHPHILPGPR